MSQLCIMLSLCTIKSALMQSACYPGAASAQKNSVNTKGAAPSPPTSLRGARRKKSQLHCPPLIPPGKEHDGGSAHGFSCMQGIDEICKMRQFMGGRATSTERMEATARMALKVFKRHEHRAKKCEHNLHQRWGTNNRLGVPVGDAPPAAPSEAPPRYPPLVFSSGAPTAAISALPCFVF